MNKIYIKWWTKLGVQNHKTNDFLLPPYIIELPILYITTNGGCQKILCKKITFQRLRQTLRIQ